MNTLTNENLFAGYDKEQGLMAFLNVEMRLNNNSERVFALCATTCTVEKWDNERKEEYCENLIEDMDSQWVLDRLKEYDCKYSDLASELESRTEEFGEHYYSMVDTLIDSEGADYQCDYSACGQHDIREDDLATFIHPSVTRLLEFWDKHHLKVISEEQGQWVLDRIKEINDAGYTEFISPDIIFKEICEYKYDAEGLY